MKTFIRSTIAVAAICLLAGWVCQQSAIAPAYSIGNQTNVLPGSVPDYMAAKLTEQVMEQLPEISTH